MAKRDAPAGAIQKWLAETGPKRPVRGQGGRGRHGDIGRFLLKEAVDVQRGREGEGLTWADVAQAAAAAGIARPDGQPYPAATFSTIWGRLSRSGKLARALGQPAHQPAPNPVQQVSTGSVPAPRGQAGTEGAGGNQPPAPVPPTTAAAPSSGQGTGEAASKEPAFTAKDLLPRRRFGDR